MSKGFIGSAPRLSFVVFLTTALVIASSNSQAIEQKMASDGKVIYGVDTRHDLYAEANPVVRSLASSTVALLHAEDFVTLADGSIELQQLSFGKSHMLCPSERFFDQGTAPFCTGFLVGPSTVISAGHCIETQKDCDGIYFAFGYAYNTPEQIPKNVPASEFFKCSKLLHTQEGQGEADFSVVEIDRPAVFHAPLQLHLKGEVSIGDSVFVIGYPSGLPAKIADGAHVRRTDPEGYFVANLDTYGGNSGSPVFNAKTFEVEGVLVRGENDFTPTDNGCMISNVCPVDGCRGEDVTRISHVLPYLDSDHPSSQVSSASLSRR